MITLKNLKEKLEEKAICKKVITAIAGFVYFEFKTYENIKEKQTQLGSANQKLFLLNHVISHGIDKFSQFANLIYNNALKPPIDRLVFNVALGAKGIVETYQQEDTKKDLLLAIKVTKTLLNDNIQEFKKTLETLEQEFNSFTPVYQDSKKSLGKSTVLASYQINIDQSDPHSNFSKN